MIETTVAQRIKMLVEALESKSADFLKATGLTYQNLHDLTSGRKGGPSFPTTTKILTAYPQVNERWLLLGTGEMLKKPAPPTISEEPQSISSYKAPAAGQTGVSAGLESHDAEEEGMPSYGVKQKPKPKGVATQLPGMDLIQQVAANTADIKRILAILEPLQQAK